MWLPISTYAAGKSQVGNLRMEGKHKNVRCKVTQWEKKHHTQNQIAPVP